MSGPISKKDLKQALSANLNGARVAFLSKPDQKDATALVADAFLDDPLMVWVAGLDESDPKRKEKMNTLCLFIHGWVNHSFFSGRRGSAVGARGLNNELVGCMTVAPSSRHKETPIDMFLSALKVGMPPMYKSKTDYCSNSGQRLDALGLLNKRRSEHMKDTRRWIYLQSIGVGSTHQGNGYGRTLLELLARTADSLAASLYLETESEANEALYHKFGYRTLEKVDLCVPGDDSLNAHLTMYLMRRDRS